MSSDDDIYDMVNRLPFSIKYIEITSFIFIIISAVRKTYQETMYVQNKTPK